MYKADVIKQEQRSYVLNITVWTVTLHQKTLN